MVTLADIDKMFPKTHDGSLYSDLFKAVYGLRPGGITFTNMKEFDADMKRLIEESNLQEDEDKARKARNEAAFEKQVSAIMSLVQGADRARAIKIIKEAEGVTYGNDELEWSFDLSYGYIERTMND